MQKSKFIKEYPKHKKKRIKQQKNCAKISKIAKSQKITCPAKFQSKRKKREKMRSS